MFQTDTCRKRKRRSEIVGPAGVHQNVRNISFKTNDKLYLGRDPRSSFFAFYFSPRAGSVWDLRSTSRSLRFLSRSFRFSFLFFLSFPLGIIACQVTFCSLRARFTLRALDSFFPLLIEMTWNFFNSCTVHTAIHDSKVLDMLPVLGNLHKRTVASEDILKP